MPWLKPWSEKAKTSASAWPTRSEAARPSCCPSDRLISWVPRISPTPSPMARMERSERSGLETELRQARDKRSGIVVLPAAELEGFDDPSVPHHQHSVGIGRGMRGMGCEDGGLSLLGAASTDQLEDVVPGVEVQVAGGLISHDDGGPVKQGPGDRNPLLLAPRDLLWPVTLEVAQVEVAHQVGDPVEVAGALPGDAKRQGDVLGDGEVGDQVEELENEPDVLAPVYGAMPLVHGGNVVAGDQPPA